jgi:hypothetical protein
MENQLKWKEAMPVYFPFNIDIFSKLKARIKCELDNLPNELWFDDEYRGCRMAMIFSGGGGYSDKDEIYSNKALPPAFTKVSERTPVLTKFLREHVQPLMLTSGRVTVIRTEPGERLRVHYDCAENEVHSYKPKMRFVVSGAVNGLFFLGHEGQKEYVSSKFDQYVINGAAPHGMDNQSIDAKYTICLGSPWNGEMTHDGEAFMQRAFDENKEFSILSDKFKCSEAEIEFQDLSQYVKS